MEKFSYSFYINGESNFLYLFTKDPVSVAEVQLMTKEAGNHRGLIIEILKTSYLSRKTTPYYFSEKWYGGWRYVTRVSYVVKGTGVLRMIDYTYSFNNDGKQLRIFTANRRDPSSIDRIVKDIEKRRDIRIGYTTKLANIDLGAHKYYEKWKSGYRYVTTLDVATRKEPATTTITAAAQTKVMTHTVRELINELKKLTGAVNITLTF